jgi:endonuclease/exonuclease/phosphatase family metal-dependent hydrolase
MKIMLKIFTLNLNYYGTRHGDWERRKKLIAEAIRENNPDIAAFQAACSDPLINAGENQLNQLAELLPEYSCRHFFTASRQEGGRQEGNALLSRFAPIETEQCLLTLTPGTEDTVRRLVAKAVFARESGDFTLFIGHFSWVAGQTKDNVREAADFISRAENYLLVGDLNTDPKDNLLQPFKQAGLVDVWERLQGDEPGFTFESDKLFTRIDYAWADAVLAPAVKTVKVVKKEHDGVRMSDHLGLQIDLDI